MLARHNRGYTLISILISFSLFFLIASLAISHLKNLTNYAHADVKKLSMTLLFLQQCALSTGKKQILEFNQAQNSYRYLDQQVSLSNNVIFRAPPGAYGPPSHHEKKLIKPISFDNSQVILYPDGKMRPGAVYIADESVRWCYAVTVPVSHIYSIYTYFFNDTLGAWELMQNQ
ncbi:MAG TPA: hypothetical protein VJ201_06270 [Candidatus Babeliales bacterium]|nr:hypothetical protein [Candidatus Babeliales bacterium]